VAAIAFGQPVAAVDTNVRRVVTRLAGAGLDGRGAPGLRVVQSLADELLDRADPATWTHAFMDLGATVCLARAPRCDECPLSSGCRSAARLGPGWSAVARDPAANAHSPGRRGLPFQLSTRWLRGRILERLRALDDGTWTQVVGPIGAHGRDAVAAALLALERDGLLERREDGSVRLPSSVG
jgi:A/G-specific adenine glycosylase